MELCLISLRGSEGNHDKPNISYAVAGSTGPGFSYRDEVIFLEKDSWKSGFIKNIFKEMSYEGISCHVLLVEDLEGNFFHILDRNLIFKNPHNSIKYVLVD